jgi:hypothetical protein
MIGSIVANPAPCRESRAIASGAGNDSFDGANEHQKDGCDRGEE